MNLAFLGVHSALGVGTETVNRVSFFLSGPWWAVFAIYSIRGLRDVPHEPATALVGRNPVMSGLRQLRHTFTELRTPT